MPNPRVRRIADRIQQIVAEMIERRLKDPRLGFVTVTDVRVTGDSQHATVFYTVLAGAPGHEGDQEAALAGTQAALDSAKGMIRSEVGRQLGMRHVPTVEFVADALPESARHLDEVLARAKALDEEAAARRGSTYAGEEDPYRKPREPDLKDADPEDADPEDADPEHADPEDADPEHADPEDADPEDADPEDADPEDADPEDVTPKPTPEDADPEDD